MTALGGLMPGGLLPGGLMIIAAYLWGGIPTAYVVARLTSGIDIRNYGSGNVGASNAGTHLGAKTGVAIALFDLIGKGVLPALLARWLGAELAIQVAVGLAAMAGHNWSPYIRFTGGRGVGAAGGLILAFGLWYEAVMVVVVIAGIGKLFFKDTGLFTLVAMGGLIICALVFDRPPEIVAMCVAIDALLIAKRLVANWERPREPVHRTLFCRILWDRDVPKRRNWTERTPTADITEASEQ